MRRYLPRVLLVCAISLGLGGACVVHSHHPDHHSRRAYPVKHKKHKKHKDHHDNGHGHAYGRHRH
ncbi:MAG TPA: hypothetical protein VFG83_08115 [Kofleriaceae bacterium]|nr:hypothetical protein [Kofleriaceae bacterium]